MHPRNRTHEPVDRLGRADARHPHEHPVQHADLRHAADQRRRHLDREELLRRDLHVVAELEVGGELDALGRRDVAVGDEDHVGHGPAGEDDAADQLAD